MSTRAQIAVAVARCVAYAAVAVLMVWAAARMATRDASVAQRLDILESAAFAQGLRLEALEAAHAGLLPEDGR